MASSSRKPDGRAWDNLSEPERQRRLDALARGRATFSARAAERKARADRGEPVADEPSVIDPASLTGAGGNGGDGSAGIGDGGGSERVSFWRNLFAGPTGGTGDIKTGGKRTATAKKALDLKGIEGLLHSIFLVLAIKAGDHWELSPQEAKQVSDAVANVARHYPVVSSQKGADWTQLLIVAAVVFGPRAFTTWDQNRQRQPARMRAQSPAAVVAAAGSAATQSPAARAPQPQPARDLEPGSPIPRPDTGTILTPGMLDPGSMSGSHATA